MTKRKPQPRKPRPVTDAEIDEAVAEVLAPPQPAISLHEQFDQQTRAILESPDLDEEQKQNILVAMSCPCCGAGAMSFTAKLKR